MYDGRDFYVADDGTEVGWVGAEAKGDRSSRTRTPVCPTTIDATELAYTSALERRRVPPAS